MMMTELKCETRNLQLKLTSQEMVHGGFVLRKCLLEVVLRLLQGLKFCAKEHGSQSHEEEDDTAGEAAEADNVLGLPYKLVEIFAVVLPRKRGRHCVPGGDRVGGRAGKGASGALHGLSSTCTQQAYAYNSTKRGSARATPYLPYYYSFTATPPSNRIRLQLYTTYPLRDPSHLRSSQFSPSAAWTPRNATAPPVIKAIAKLAAR